MGCIQMGRHSLTGSNTYVCHTLLQTPISMSFHPKPLLDCVNKNYLETKKQTIPIFQKNQLSITHLNLEQKLHNIYK